MGLTTENDFNIEVGGVLIDKRKGSEIAFVSYEFYEGNYYANYWYKVHESEVMEWPALTREAAEDQVLNQPQPLEEDFYDDAEWELMEDDRVVGSYILTRTRTKTETVMESTVPEE